MKSTIKDYRIIEAEIKKSNNLKIVYIPELLMEYNPFELLPFNNSFYRPKLEWYRCQYNQFYVLIDYNLKVHFDKHDYEQYDYDDWYILKKCYNDLYFDDYNKAIDFLHEQINKINEFEIITKNVISKVKIEHDKLNRILR